MLYASEVPIVQKVNSSTRKISYAYLFGIPLVTVFFSTNLNDPFNVPKQIILIVISSILLVEISLKYYLSPIKRKSPEFLIFLVISLFCGSQVITLLVADNASQSFFGETSRRNGLVTYLGLSILMIYGFRFFSNLNATLFYKMLLFTTIPVVVYGLVQITGNDFVEWNNPYNNAIATFGNPNFTSAFLAISFVACFVLLFIKSISFIIKLVAISLSVCSLVIILASQSRQGLYAIFVALVFYLNVKLYLQKSKLRVFVYFSSLLMALLSIFGMLQKGPFSSILYKDSVSVRGYYWRAGVEMFLNNPLTGVGLDQYGNFYRQFKELEYVNKFGYELTSTDAHNTFIQLFATSGAMAGISYLLLIFIVYLSGYRFLKKSANTNEQNIMLGLLSIFTAFQAQSFISISNLGISVWGWSIGGVIFGIFYYSDVINDDLHSKNNLQFARKSQVNLFKPIIQVFLLVPVMLLSIYVYRSESDMFLLRGIANPSFPNNKIAVQEYSNKVFLNPFSDLYLKIRSALYLGDMGLMEEGYSKMQALEKSYPDNYEVLWSLAIYEEKLGNIEKTINTRLKISEIDPYNTKNYLILLNLYKMQNNTVMMQNMVRRIITLNKDGQDAKDALEIAGKS